MALRDQFRPCAIRERPACEKKQIVRQCKKKCFLNRNTKKPSRQLNIISTHDSPVAPNAGNVVDGVASLLFVYAVA